VGGGRELEGSRTADALGPRLDAVCFVEDDEGPAPAAERQERVEPTPVLETLIVG
jgi:hypothetical protein